MGRETWRCSICDGWGRGVARDTHTWIVSNGSDAHKIFLRGRREFQQFQPLSTRGRWKVHAHATLRGVLPLPAGKWEAILQNCCAISVDFFAVLWDLDWVDRRMLPNLVVAFQVEVNEGVQGVDQIMRARVIQTRFEVRCVHVLKTGFQIKERCFWITPGCWCHLLHLFTLSLFSLCKCILRWKRFTFLTCHCE